MGLARARVVVWLPALAWAALIFALSAQPNLRFLPDDLSDLVLRKLGHAGVFGILALLVALAVRASKGAASSGSVGGVAFALTVLYAVGDEIHQAAVEGRHASALDVGIDACGALVLLLAGAAVRRSRATGRDGGARPGASGPGS